MNIKNAVKKLEKIGTVKKENGKYFIEKNGRLISFFANGGYGEEEDREAICFKVQRIKDPDEFQSDYSGGSFFDNLTQAIKYVQK